MFAVELVTGVDIIHSRRQAVLLLFHTLSAVGHLVLTEVLWENNILFVLKI
jgi:hypothetical protein